MIPEQLYGAVARCLSLPERSVAATVRLLDDGATIPFISRYRKEATGELDEVAVAAISKEAKRLRELDRRKEYIVETVCAQGKLTPELKEKIESESDAARLEDIFAPYRPRKRTRAAVAREKGLEPLAAILMAQNVKDVQAAAGRFVRRPDVGDAAEAIEGAKDIVAEWVSDNARVRGKVRNVFSRTAQISASVVKDKISEASKYANYDGYTRRLRDIPSHNYLALRRGEREGLLKVSVIPDNDSALRAVTEVVVKRGGSPSATRVVGDAVADSYKRLLRPAMETEVSSAVKDRADREAIGLFASNLEQLLLAPPLGRKRILAIDPGYRTGCKIVCLDSQGNLLHHDVIYPCAPRNDRRGAEAIRRHQTLRLDKDDRSVGNRT
ncbi:MAG: RNA-binding transcriptional accessory protein, partial [Muribaculaceae bacterium]|nr:RNA-binding transcriptional accessory protein [Muribaculaceae bacterium]